MKPLNLDNKPCSPISSNCVLWQGPDIPCINLCKGDTVSDVVAALAEELCCVLNILDINSYDLSCFNINQSKPDDFKAFIQFLTERICALENIDPHSHEGLGEGECPTGCIVTVAEPFQEDDHTTMNLVDYSLAMGNKIAENIDEINLNKGAIANHEVRITGLEVAPPPTFTLPSVIPNCVLPSVPTPMDQVLSALESAYCNYVSNNGTIADITTAVGAECAGLSASPSKVNHANSMSVEYAGTWIAGATTLAQSMNNLWITVCDIRDAVATTVSVTDSETIDLTLVKTSGNYDIQADLIDTGWVDLEGFQFYPGSLTKPQVRRIGKVLHFRGIIFIPLSSDGGATLIPFLAANSYHGRTEIAPYTGAGGGVTLNSNGALYFNTSLNVIPASVLPLATQLDAAYVGSNTVATRSIDLDATYGTSLSAHGNVCITPDKKLYFSTLKDLEITSTRPGGWLGSSALRFITSNIRAGEFVPNYIDVNTDIHNAPANADFPLTSGTRNTTWPLSCDAGEETDLGAFGFKIDGLIAYID
jgi:hypothetical protein